MLDPERAVLVEGRDPLFGWREAGARLVGCDADEFEDRAACRSVIPGGQRRGLRLRSADEVGPCRKCRERGEDAAPIQAAGG